MAVIGKYISQLFSGGNYDHRPGKVLHLNDTKKLCIEVNKHPESFGWPSTGKLPSWLRVSLPKWEAATSRSGRAFF